MKILGFFVLFLFCGLMKCEIYLSRREVAEITKIAEESMADQAKKSLATEKTVYIEPTPPELTTPAAIDEIETIRRNISASEEVECNITARYMWELCRPVLLRTCKEQYRSRCRTSTEKYRTFNRRLNREFPIVPPNTRLFKPEPLLKWFENQVSRLPDSTSIQFTVTITNNNNTRTFTNQNTAENFAGMNEEFRRALNNLRKKYRNLFPIFPFPTDTERPKKSFVDWILQFLEDDNDREEHVVVVPAEEKRGREPSSMIPEKRRAKRSFSHGRHWTRRMRTQPHPPRKFPLFHPYSMRTNWRQRFLPGIRHWSPVSPWQRDFTRVHPAHRMPEFLRGRRPPFLPPNLPPFGNRRRFFLGRNNEEDEDEREEDERNGMSISFSCGQMEEHPEVCLEIAERTEKCENELKQVCPEYVETRRRIKEQLDGIYSRQHQVSQFETGREGGGRGYQTNEKYEWVSLLNGRKKPIVIDSVKINRRENGDAYVTAKLFETVDLNLRVPGADFNSDTELGAAIGKLAFESYDTFLRRHRGEP